MGVWPVSTTILGVQEEVGECGGMPCSRIGHDRHHLTNILHRLCVLLRAPVLILLGLVDTLPCKTHSSLSSPSKNHALLINWGCCCSGKHHPDSETFLRR